SRPHYKIHSHHEACRDPNPKQFFLFCHNPSAETKRAFRFSRNAQVYQESQRIGSASRGRIAYQLVPSGAWPGILTVFSLQPSHICNRSSQVKSVLRKTGEKLAKRILPSGSNQTEMAPALLTHSFSPGPHPTSKSLLVGLVV